MAWLVGTSSDFEMLPANHSEVLLHKSELVKHCSILFVFGNYCPGMD